MRESVCNAKINDENTAVIVEVFKYSTIGAYYQIFKFLNIENRTNMNIIS